jgi:hypothetical protein
MKSDQQGKKTDNTMDKRKRTDNTMDKRKRTDNTMDKRKRTDNTMDKRKRTDNTLQILITHLVPFNLFLHYLGTVNFNNKYIAYTM